MARALDGSGDTGLLVHLHRNNLRPVFLNSTAHCLIARDTVFNHQIRKVTPWGAHADVQWMAPFKSEAGYHVMAVCRSAPCVVGGDRVCAYLPGSRCSVLLSRAHNDNSFRGSIAGLSFAYCDFTHYQGAAQTGRGEHPLS
jgi:hypothetical protein